MRCLHYFDPQLFDFGGHYFNYCEQVRREMARRKCLFQVYARKGCQVVCGGVRPEAVFTHDIFRELWTDTQTWAIENFNNLNLAFLSDLMALPPTRFQPADLAFFPSLIQNQLHGIAMWMMRLPSAHRPAVAVLLRFLNHDMPYVRAREHHHLLALYYRFAAQALKRAQPRTVFCVDTDEMAAAYTDILGLPVTTLSVAMEPMSNQTSAPASRAVPRIGYLGHTNSLKGFHLLPDIIEKTRASGVRAQFLVHVQSRQPANGFDMRPAVARLDRLAGPDVELIEGGLAPARYYDLLAGCDIVVLPYSPIFYRHCSSGIFAEAVALGKVLVIPDGTVPARQARDYQAGVEIAVDDTPGSIAAALGKAVHDLEALQQRAMTARERFAREQSVGNFWDKLLGVIATLDPAKG